MIKNILNILKDRFLGHLFLSFISFTLLFLFFSFFSLPSFYFIYLSFCSSNFLTIFFLFSFISFYLYLYISVYLSILLSIYLEIYLCVVYDYKETVIKRASIWFKVPNFEDDISLLMKQHVPWSTPIIFKISFWINFILLLKESATFHKKNIVN